MIINFINKIEVIKFNKKRTSYRKYLFNDLPNTVLSNTKKGWVLREKGGGARVLITDKEDLEKIHKIFCNG